MVDVDQHFGRVWPKGASEVHVVAPCRRGQSPFRFIAFDIVLHVFCFGVSRELRVFFGGDFGLACHYDAVARESSNTIRSGAKAAEIRGVQGKSPKNKRDRCHRAGGGRVRFALCWSVVVPEGGLVYVGGQLWGCSIEDREGVGKIGPKSAVGVSPEFRPEPLSQG